MGDVLNVSFLGQGQNDQLRPANVVEPLNQCVSTSKIYGANLVVNNRGVPVLGKKRGCKIDASTSAAAFIRVMP